MQILYESFATCLNLAIVEQGTKIGKPFCERIQAMLGTQHDCCLFFLNLKLEENLLNGCEPACFPIQIPNGLNLKLCDVKESVTNLSRNVNKITVKSIGKLLGYVFLLRTIQSYSWKPLKLLSHKNHWPQKFYSCFVTLNLFITPSIFKTLLLS